MNNKIVNLSQVADVKIRRSSFDLGFEHKLTAPVGKLIPFYLQECLPGSTYKIDVNSLVRAATPIVCPLDAAELSMWFFFVPNRIVWDNFENFITNGEGSPSRWSSTTNSYKIPKIRFNDESEQVYAPSIDSPLAYFGAPTTINKQDWPFPTGQSPVYGINALPLRGYISIWNNWFRDENYMSEVYEYKGDTDILIDTSSSPVITNAYKGQYLLPVCKKHDLFTDCVPAPQAHSDIKIPLADFAWLSSNGSILHSLGSDSVLLGDSSNDEFSSGSITYEEDGLKFGVAYDESAGADVSLGSTNLGIKGSDLAGSINELRTAFQLQRFYENSMANRYKEALYMHFGTISPDARLQIPEYIGGATFPLNMIEVLQTAETGSTPQGNVSGMSKTFSKNNIGTYSSQEHGMIIGVFAVRISQHTYCQGYDPFLLKSSQFDFYFPELAHIGYQPIQRNLIYATYPGDDTVFGYNEAWSTYRRRLSKCSGYFNVAATGSIGDKWTYADNYATAPTLSASWLYEDGSLFNRTLAVESDKTHPLLCDFYFDVKGVLPMPTHSTPGLADHF